MRHKTQPPVDTAHHASKPTEAPAAVEAHGVPSNTGAGGSKDCASAAIPLVGAATSTSLRAFAPMLRVGPGATSNSGPMDVSATPLPTPTRALPLEGAGGVADMAAQPSRPHLNVGLPILPPRPPSLSPLGVP